MAKEFNGLSQFRVDDIDRGKTIKVLAKYHKLHPEVKYLVSQEISEKTKKPHLQGWVKHNQPDNSYRKHMHRQYKLGTHGMCMTPVVGTFENWASYILNNDNKEDVQYSDVITNYTEEEFAVFKTFPRRLKKEEFIKQSKKTKSQDWYFRVLERIEEQCIANGNRIDYSGARQLYLEDPPKMFSAQEMNRALNGMFVRLENKYPQNSRARNRMLSQVESLGDGLYDPVINYSDNT